MSEAIENTVTDHASSHGQHGHGQKTLWQRVSRWLFTTNHKDNVLPWGIRCEFV